MKKKTYSKVWTQFETQCTAYTKLRMGLPFPQYMTRGYEGFIKIYKPTEDHDNPVDLLTIHVRSSGSKSEVGFFKQTEDEYLLIGGDAAWKIVDAVLPILHQKLSL